MLAYLLLGLVCLQVCIAQIPPTPVISNVFSSAVNVTIVDENGEHHGNGMSLEARLLIDCDNFNRFLSGQWAINQPEGKGIEWYVFDHQAYSYGILERYDLVSIFHFYRKITF